MAQSTGSHIALKSKKKLIGNPMRPLISRVLRDPQGLKCEHVMPWQSVLNAGNSDTGGSARPLDPLTCAHHREAKNLAVAKLAL
jgi:hypothetical protein